MREVAEDKIAVEWLSVLDNKEGDLLFVFFCCFEKLRKKKKKYVFCFQLSNYV